ncbi:MAG TPA: AraC family transcriptional regulator [Bryobacteraceae bacterium]|jgi:AraC-like DNA-binding protein
MYREFRPAPHLERFVECYWHRQDSCAQPRHCVLPDGCSDILFTGEKLAFVGLMTRPLESPIAADARFFGIRFRPGMASAFLMREQAVATDSFVTLDRAAERRLGEQLAEARDPIEMVARAEAYLGSPAYQPPPVLAALTALANAGEPLERVIETTGASPRHLRRLCQEHAGVSPKFLSRILRFRQAVERLRKQRPQAAWADFAAVCGYFDQAHMIREFQEFAGVSPGRFVQSLLDESRLESSHEFQT